jgi:hypothetical protein
MLERIGDAFTKPKLLMTTLDQFIVASTVIVALGVLVLGLACFLKCLDCADRMGRRKRRG